MAATRKRKLSLLIRNSRANYKAARYEIRITSGQPALGGNSATSQFMKVRTLALSKRRELKSAQISTTAPSCTPQSISFPDRTSSEINNRGSSPDRITQPSQHGQAFDRPLSGKSRKAPPNRLRSMGRIAVWVKSPNLWEWWVGGRSSAAVKTWV